MRGLPFALGLVVCTASPVRAQVSLLSVRDLSFGTVPLSVTTVVGPSDATRSGQFTLTGRPGMQVQVRLTLPNRLANASGATIPIAFQSGDAFILETITGGAPDYFNPGATKVFKFTTGSQAILRLGGRVTPGSTVPMGAYSNTVLATVTVLNL